MPRPGQASPSDRTFAFDTYSVAISFSGKQDNLIRALAKRVEELLLYGEVFFDEYRESEIRGLDAEQYLSQVFERQAVLVIRCLSSTYGHSSWTRVELEAIKKRDEKFRYDVAADGFVYSDGMGTKIDVVLLGEKPEQAAMEIVNRIRIAFNNGPDIRYLQICNPFQALELIDALSAVNINDDEIQRAVPKSVTAPSPEPSDCWTIKWWINRLRQKSWGVFEEFLQNIWPKFNRAERSFVRKWFRVVAQQDFLEPTLSNAQPWICQVVIGPDRIPGQSKSQSIYELRAQIWSGTVQKDSTFEKRGLNRAQLRSAFYEATEHAFKYAKTIDRVELMLPVAIMVLPMHDWEVRNGISKAPLGWVHEVTVRSWERAVGKISAADARPILPMITPYFSQQAQSFSEWNMWNTQHGLVVNALNRGETGHSAEEVLGKIVQSRVPVAMWFFNVDQAWINTHQGAISLCFAGAAQLPGHTKSLRINKCAPNASHAILMYEDPNVPIPSYVNDYRYSDAHLASQILGENR